MLVVGRQRARNRRDVQRNVAEVAAAAAVAVSGGGNRDSII